MRTLFLTSLRLLPVVFLLAMSAPAEVPTPLQAFEPFVGRTWKALVDETKGLYDVARWDRAVGGQVVRIEHALSNGGYGGETLIRWDSASESLVYTYYTTAGFVTQGTMAFDASGRTLTSRETVAGNAGGVTEVESTQRLMPDGSLEVATRMLRDGVWEDRGSVVYVEDAEAVVEMP